MKNLNFQRILFFLLLFSVSLVPFDLQGQPPSGIVLDEVPKGRYFERVAHRKTNFLEMEHFGDVFHSNKFLLGRNRISGSVSYNWGRVVLNDQDGYRSTYRNALGFFTRIRFYEEFSLNTTFYKNFNPEANVRWIGDFSYAIGRFTWRPNKFNYGYENFVHNKYTDSWDELGKKFMEGSYFVSYSHFLPEQVLDKIRLDSTTNVRLTYFTKYAVMYRDENDKRHGGLLDGKPVMGMGIRYTMFWNIYIEGGTYFYFNPAKQQQPWDPDYSYGFGYFDWRAFRFSLTYGNWAINRFPWNGQKEYPYYGFLDGQFKFQLNYIW